MSDADGKFFHQKVRELCAERGFPFEELNAKVQENLDHPIIAWEPASGGFSLHHVSILSQFFEVPMRDLYPALGEIPDDQPVFSCDCSDEAVMKRMQAVAEAEEKDAIAKGLGEPEELPNECMVVYPYCPTCGEKAELYDPEGAEMTTLGFAQSYVEDGVTHTHNPNSISAKWTCYSGHSWATKSGYGCACGWKNRHCSNSESALNDHG